MKIIKFVNKYLNKYKMIIYLSLSFLLWIISMFLPLINGNFIDVIVSNNLTSNIYNFLVIISILSILKIVLTYISNFLYSKLLSKTIFEISYYILNHLKKLPIFFFYNQNVGYLSQRINIDTTAISEFVISDIKNLIINALSLIISSVILVNINIKLALVLLILIPIYLVLYISFKKKLYKLNFRYKESQNRYLGEINYQLENIKFIKLNSLFSILNKNLINKFNILFDDLVNLTRISNIFANSGILITVIANILILFLGLQQITNGNLSIGHFTIIGTYFNIIIKDIEYFLSFLEKYQNTLVSYSRLIQLVTIDTEINGNRTIKNIENIIIENLSFKYPNGKTIVSNLNYEFKKGFIYKIKGENGIGKSSIINIITGMYNGSYEGQIKYNNINILELNMYKIREKLIGVVEQEPNLLKDTILNNITYNLDNYDYQTLENLIKILNLDKFISNLKDGINTNIAERNYNVSGGEKQKLSILRILLKNPNVIILDEANSALDYDTLNKLNSILEKEKENKIIILISHSNIFDKIVDFEFELKN